MKEAKQAKGVKASTGLAEQHPWLAQMRGEMQNPGLGGRSSGSAEETGVAAAEDTGDDTDEPED
eukprot:6714838-Lingulodinium_polyedra.AAC.1